MEAQVKHLFSWIMVIANVVMLIGALQDGRLWMAMGSCLLIVLTALVMLHKPPLKVEKDSIDEPRNCVKL